MKRIPPTRWGRNPSSEWERVGASRADRPHDVVIVVVEYYCFLIIMIVGASVPRPVENLLCFTALSLPYELKTIVLASRALA